MSTAPQGGLALTPRVEGGTDNHDGAQHPGGIATGKSSEVLDATREGANSLPGTRRATSTRILLLHPGHLGDVILALSAMRAARQTYPYADITAVVKAPADQLLALTGWFDRVWRMPHLGRFEGFAPYVRWMDLMTRMAFARADTALCYMPDPEAQILLAATGAGLRAGAHKARQWYTRAWMTCSLPWESLTPARHRRFGAIAELAGLNVPHGPALADVPLPEDARREAATFVNGRGPLVTLLVCGSQAHRRWPLARYVELVRSLHVEYGVSPVVVTGPGEVGLVGDIRARIVEPGFATHMHARPLPVLAALLRLSDAIVTVDSGPGHLAAALGRSCVYLMPAHKLKLFRPPGGHVLPLTARHELGEIGADAVLDALDPLLRPTI